VVVRIGVLDDIAQNLQVRACSNEPVERVVNGTASAEPPFQIMAIPRWFKRMDWESPIPDLR